MKKVKILHSEANHYCDQARKVLDSFAQVDYGRIGRTETLKKVSSYDGLIVRLQNKVDRKIIDAGRQLKFIATATTGVDHIDTEYLKKKKIQLICLKGERQFLKSVYSTAELTFGLILSLLRRIPSAFNEVVYKDHWIGEQFRGHELAGKTIGIIGYGRLGHMVARYANGFGMKVCAYDIDKTIKYPKYVAQTPLNKLLSTADVVSIHIPLNEKNEKFIDAKAIARIKKDGVLINTSRGAVIDEKALLSALKKKKFAGVACDVLSDEIQKGFHPLGNPLCQYARKHDNVIVTPHIGGAAFEAIDKTDVFIAQKIKRFINRKRL